MASLDELAKAGIDAINSGRIEDAIDHFTEALEHAPDRPDMNHALGTAYLHRLEVGSALTYLRRAVELSEPFTDERFQDLKRQFHMDLAKALTLLNQLGEAVEFTKKVHEMWPEALEPRLMLAQIYLSSCRLEEGLKVYSQIADDSSLDKAIRQAADSVVGSVRVWQESEEPASIFLRAHCDSYIEYFTEVAKAKERDGWYIEAARMSRGPGGEAKPIIAEGARPYAMTRVDLVDPHTGEIGGVYSEQEPMVVTVEGLEPLAQHRVMVPWSDHAFEVWVCSQVPWHWLTITVQFSDADTEETLIEAIDPMIADWYISGYNGDFGTRDAGRFHYISDPEIVGDRAVCYTIDLGRASFEAIHSLMNRLTVLHTKRSIERVLFGSDRLP